MQIRLLGRVEVGDDRGFTSAGTARQAAVLSVLALSRGEPVAVETIAERVWGAEQPEQVRGTIYAYVARLRKVLRGRGADLVTTEGGYLLERVEQVDVHLMRALAVRGRAEESVGDLAAAVEAYREAAALWRGVPLAGVRGAWAERVRDGLQQERLTLLAARFGAELELGDDSTALAELPALVAAHPNAEPLAACLMLALHRRGRTAEALACFAQARRWCLEELGAEPGPALRELHLRILRTDRALLTPRHPAPGNLPRDLGDFAGRSAEVTAFTSELAGATGPAVRVLDGMAGVGKTTLAVRLAHLLAPRYPDGQLFTDLRGHSEGLAPLRPTDALDVLLRQLGVGPQRIPYEPGGRAALWRSETSRRRLLVLCDNALDAAQVEPLLPGGDGCLVLVTSRTRLTSIDGARPMPVSVLPTAEGVAMLTQIIGERRALADPKAVAEIVRLCGGLPLAIRLAGARLAHRPQWSPADLVARLADEEGRLAALAVRDRGVAAAFTLSYQQLGERHRLIFALAGRHPGESVTAPVIATMAGLPVAAAEEVLQDLADAHLVDEPVPGRFRQHDLLRQYARESALEAPGWRSAAERMLGHYLASAVAATGHIGDMRPAKVMRVTAAERPDPAITGPASALAWLTAERTNVLAAIEFAAATGWPVFGQQLAFTMWRFLMGHSVGECAGALGLGVEAARAAGDPRAEAILTVHLALTYRQQGRRIDAERLLDTAIATGRRIGDPDIEACAIAFRSILLLERADYAEALTGAHDVQTITADPTAGLTPELRSTALTVAGWVLGVVTAGLGDQAGGLALLRQSVTDSAAAGDGYLEAEALAVLASGLDSVGQPAESIAYYRRSIERYRLSADIRGEAVALCAIGRITRLGGDGDEALSLQLTALDALADVGDPHAEAVVHNDLGLTLRAAGRNAEAADHHRAALAAAQRAHHPLEEARAHAALAAALPECQEHRTAADTIFDRFGIPPAHPSRTPA